MCSSDLVNAASDGPGSTTATAGDLRDLLQDSAPGSPRFEIDLVDRGRAVGQIRVHFDEFEFVPPEVVARCQEAALLLAQVAARQQTEMLLLRAQCEQVTGQIAAGLVHDFNNMLTGIMGNAAMVLGLIPPGDALALPLRRIEEAASGAGRVARALLDFVRGTLEYGPVSLNDVAAATELVLSRALRDEVELVLDLDPTLPPVAGERALLQQALVNLVVNGAEAIDGEGTVTIRTRRLQGAAARRPGIAPGASVVVALSVTDSGRGIEAEHLAELFRPFFTTKGPAGTGLGLASVARIARRHRGEVTVESQPGAGSTFTLYLPVDAPVDLGGTEERRVAGVMANA